MARSTWSGAITFAGFPIPVKAYNLTPTSKDQSFRTLCECHGAAIAQQNVCTVTNTVLAADKQRKGVEVGKSLHMLDATAVESIKGSATEALEIEAVCPIATLDLHAHKGGLVIVPEPKKGAEKPVAILWRTLGKLDAAAVTRYTPRAGSPDTILAIYAGPKGLLAANLPFEHQLSDTPVFAACDVAVADAEVAMFENALTSMYPNRDYRAGDFVSEHNARRQAAIAAAVAGKPIATTAAPAAAPVPDLMAALAASLAAVQTPNAKEAVPA